MTGMVRSGVAQSPVRTQTSRVVVYVSHGPAQSWHCSIVARTETKTFFETVWDKATALLFLKGRPAFYHQSGKIAANCSGAPVVLIAYGQDDADRLRGSGLVGKYVQL